MPLSARGLRAGLTSAREVPARGGKPVRRRFPAARGDRDLRRLSDPRMVAACRPHAGAGASLLPGLDDRNLESAREAIAFLRAAAAPLGPRVGMLSASTEKETWGAVNIAPTTTPPCHRRLHLNLLRAGEARARVRARPGRLPPRCLLHPDPAASRSTARKPLATLSSPCPAAASRSAADERLHVRIPYKVHGGIVPGRSQARPIRFVPIAVCDDPDSFSAFTNLRLRGDACVARTESVSSSRLASCRWGGPTHASPLLPSACLSFAFLPLVGLIRSRHLRLDGSPRMARRPRNRPPIPPRDLSATAPATTPCGAWPGMPRSASPCVLISRRAARTLSSARERPRRSSSTRSSA